MRKPKSSPLKRVNLQVTGASEGGDAQARQSTLSRFSQNSSMQLHSRRRDR